MRIPSLQQADQEDDTWGQSVSKGNAVAFPFGAGTHDTTVAFSSCEICARDRPGHSCAPAAATLRVGRAPAAAWCGRSDRGAPHLSHCAEDAQPAQGPTTLRVVAQGHFRLSSDERDTLMRLRITRQIVSPGRRQRQPALQRRQLRRLRQMPRPNPTSKTTVETLEDARWRRLEEQEYGRLATEADHLFDTNYTWVA